MSPFLKFPESVVPKAANTFAADASTCAAGAPAFSAASSESTALSPGGVLNRFCLIWCSAALNSRAPGAVGSKLSGSTVTLATTPAKAAPPAAAAASAAPGGSAPGAAAAASAAPAIAADAASPPTGGASVVATASGGTAGAGGGAGLALGAGVAAGAVGVAAAGADAGSWPV